MISHAQFLNESIAEKKYPLPTSLRARDVAAISCDMVKDVYRSVDLCRQAQRIQRRKAEGEIKVANMEGDVMDDSQDPDWSSEEETATPESSDSEVEVHLGSPKRMSVDEGIQLRQDLPRTKSDDDDEEELPSPEPAAGPSSGRKTKPQTSCLVPGCRGYSGPNLMWHLTEVHIWKGKLTADDMQRMFILATADYRKFGAIRHSGKKKKQEAKKKVKRRRRWCSSQRYKNYLQMTRHYQGSDEEIESWRPSPSSTPFASPACSGTSWHSNEEAIGCIGLIYVCSPTPYTPNELHVIPLKSCRKDLTHYLTNLGVSGSRGFGIQINKADVILNRTGLHSLSEEDKEKITVCPKHRYELTTHYQKLKSSRSHPSHRGEAKKLKNPCWVNKQVSEEIYQEFQVSVPVGFVLCNTCQKGHSTRFKVEDGTSKCEDELKDEVENTGKEGSDLTKKESLVNECSGFKSTVLAFEDNINFSYPASSEFECTLNSTVTRLKEEDEEISFWDIAYGTKELKLDSGEKIPILNVIRTMVPSRIIKQYISYCQETEFNPASERTYRIIGVYAASRQKSLQGLDYFLTEGAQAFESVEHVIMVLEEGGATSIWGKEAKAIIREAKRYLKTNFKSHVGPKERCVDNCTGFSLNNPHIAFTQRCNHIHDMSCPSCSQQDEVLSNVMSMINSPKLTLTDEEHILVTIKQEHPNVEMAYLKSDNAVCYHNASLILSLKSIGERAGITVQRYDFSDPQSGKDVCDRKIALMKGHMQRWVNEKHEVVTAIDMKEALESYGGVRGCRITVAEVDVAKAAKTKECKGISPLFNFELLSSGIRAWKAYGVGEATQRQQKAPGEPLVEQDEVISEEDLQVWETERQLQELQTAVNEEVNLKHPIEYNGHDICGLTKRGMLKSKFKLPQLKEICTLFGIEI
ncbi:hypothetical protein AWC38_SpisGene11813 [Stylophora pistillata]|uniref:C2H2-type domain-containing protein n=1 Tax=Stylophora pistillata TaxID=50429 RepID=A0A2B4S152_STYPI|nr:hypothetical protein AWC38_SpisGene11813 [Stylophora pistillata]